MTINEMTAKRATTMSRLSVLAATAGLAVLATACSSSSDPASSERPTTRVTTVSVTPKTTQTTTEQAGIASGEPNPAASSSGPTACLESQLRASIDPRHIPGNGTAGSDGRHLHGVLVDFENTSDTTCTLTGYPGAAIVGSDGKQVQQAKRVTRGQLGGGTAQKTVTLRSGAYASALLEGVDTREQGAAQAGCDGAKNPKILVTPPNTETAVPFTVGWPLCTSFTVHPVVALSSKP